MLQENKTSACSIIGAFPVSREQRGPQIKHKLIYNGMLWYVRTSQSSKNARIQTTTQ